MTYLAIISCLFLAYLILVMDSTVLVFTVYF